MPVDWNQLLGCSAGIGHGIGAEPSGGVQPGRCHPDERT